MPALRLAAFKWVHLLLGMLTCHSPHEEHTVKQQVPHLLVEEVPCALLLIEHSLPFIHQVLLIGPDVGLELCSFLQPAVTRHVRQCLLQCTEGLETRQVLTLAFSFAHPAGQKELLGQGGAA